MRIMFCLVVFLITVSLCEAQEQSGKIVMDVKDLTAAQI